MLVAILEEEEAVPWYGLVDGDADGVEGAVEQQQRVLAAEPVVGQRREEVRQVGGEAGGVFAFSSGTMRNVPPLPVSVSLPIWPMMPSYAA